MDVLLTLLDDWVLEHEVYVVQNTFMVTKEASCSYKENIMYLEDLILTSCLLQNEDLIFKPFWLMDFLWVSDETRVPRSLQLCTYKHPGLCTISKYFYSWNYTELKIEKCGTMCYESQASSWYTVLSVFELVDCDRGGKKMLLESFLS